jgi:hypothetical protein
MRQQLGGQDLVIDLIYVLYSTTGHISKSKMAICGTWVVETAPVHAVLVADGRTSLELSEMRTSPGPFFRWI